MTKDQERLSQIWRSIAPSGDMADWALAFEQAGEVEAAYGAFWFICQEVDGYRHTLHQVLYGGHGLDVVSKRPEWPSLSAAERQAMQLTSAEHREINRRLLSDKRWRQRQELDELSTRLYLDAQRRYFAREGRVSYDL